MHIAKAHFNAWSYFSSCYQPPFGVHHWSDMGKRCYSLQVMLTLLRNKLENAELRVTPNSLVITGGCALNVKTNTALARGLNLPAHVPPAPGDNGIPLGAAWCPDGSLVGSWGGRRQHTVVDCFVFFFVFFLKLIFQKFAGCPVAEYDHLTLFGYIIPYHICMSVSVFLNGFFPQKGA